MSEAEIKITVRAPRFEHASTPHNWLPNNPEFGYRLNGGSLTLPYLEPYLIRVMRMAREQLADGSAESLELPRQALLRDIDRFNGQEANHFKIHRAYNAFLRDRYEGLEALEAELEADFARFLREESLEWNLGYSAGFETTGMMMAELFFGEAEPGMKDADPSVHGLWAWHLAEEYEHRCVAFEVFRAMGGGYFRRVELFFYQARHLASFGERAAALMMEQDRAAGLLPEAAEITPARKRLASSMSRAMRWRVLRGVLPGHNPRRHGPIAAADAFLDTLEYA